MAKGSPRGERRCAGRAASWARSPRQLSTSISGSLVGFLAIPGFVRSLERLEEFVSSVFGFAYKA